MKMRSIYLWGGQKHNEKLITPNQISLLMILYQCQFLHFNYIRCYHWRKWGDGYRWVSVLFLQRPVSLQLFQKRIYELYPSNLCHHISLPTSSRHSLPLPHPPTDNSKSKCFHWGLPKKQKPIQKSDILNIYWRKHCEAWSEKESLQLARHFQHLWKKRGRKEPQTVQRTEEKLSQACEESLSTLPVRGVPRGQAGPVLVPPPSSVITGAAWLGTNTRCVQRCTGKWRLPVSCAPRTGFPQGRAEQDASKATNWGKGSLSVSLPSFSPLVTLTQCPSVRLIFFLLNQSKSHPLLPLSAPCLPITVYGKS